MDSYESTARLRNKRTFVQVSKSNKGLIGLVNLGHSV